MLITKLSALALYNYIHEVKCSDVIGVIAITRRRVGGILSVNKNINKIWKMKILIQRYSQMAIPTGL